jgi:uncharacterized protein YndB with AHSA1/START domain
MAGGDSVVDMPAKVTVIERVFDAPRERVFEMFTKPEHIQKWWGPKMQSAPVTEFDARAGGKVFFVMREPDGVTHYDVGVVHEIMPPSRVVFALHWANEKRERISPAAAGVPGTWGEGVLFDVTFFAEGPRTRVTIRLSGIAPEWSETAIAVLKEQLDKLAFAAADDMTVTPTGDREIVITRTFDAPRTLVFEALTKVEHVKNWWGPRQYGPVSATADFRAGGHYRFAQGSPQGEVAFSGEVRESSHERIVYIEEFEAMPGHAAVTTVTLDERAGKTFMKLCSVYQSPEDRDGVIASGMEWGARLSYLQLDEVLEGMQ